LLVTALLTTVSDVRLRYTGMIITNVLSAYTGYGIFISLITPFVILTDSVKSRSEKLWKYGALLLTVASTLSFFIGYRFTTDSACSIPDPQPLRYVQLLAYYYNSPLGLPFLNPTAYVALVGLLATGAWTARRALAPTHRRQFVPLALLF